MRRISHVPAAVRQAAELRGKLQHRGTPRMCAIVCSLYAGKMSILRFSCTADTRLAALLTNARHPERKLALPLQVRALNVKGAGGDHVPVPLLELGDADTLELLRILCRGCRRRVVSPVVEKANRFGILQVNGECSTASRGSSQLREVVSHDVNDDGEALFLTDG